MRRIVLLFVTFVTITMLGQAQSWDYFWKPRHVGVKILTGAAPTYAWLFKPTFTVSATCIRPTTISGGSADAQFLSAAGPALTLQHTSVLPDGSDYADYSANLVLLVAGSTSISPTFRPAAALTIGALNNIVNVGGGYDLMAREDGLSQWFILVSIGVNLTNN